MSCYSGDSDSDQTATKVPAAAGGPVPTFPTIQRDRLTARLSQAVRTAQVTVVSAPPGSGKTVAAAAWATQTPASGEVAWLRLARPDRDPAVFWRHLLAALTPQPSDTLRRPWSAEPSPEEGIIDSLVAGLASDGPSVTLVLDCFEQVQDDAVCEGLDDLLGQTGDALRLVILTRGRPALPLHRYRLEGRLAELGLEELRFTSREVAETLSRHDLRPSGPATDVVARLTEGWAAGVRLVALALQERATPSPSADDVLASLATGDSLLAEYMRAEVIAELTPGELDLLRCCSVVDAVPPGLADALTGGPDGDRLLALLARRNHFVRQVSRETFRMHPLFRECLYVHFRSEHPAQVAQLHRRAAQWLAASGRYPEAVEQASRGGDWESATTLVVESCALAGVLLGSSTAADLAECLAELPQEVETPAAAVVRAALAITSNDLPLAADRMADADANLPQNGRAGLSVALVRTCLCQAAQDADGTLAAARDARQLLACLPQEAIEIDATLGLIQRSEAAARFRKGELDTVATLLSDALLHFAEREFDAPRMDSLALLALVEACRGHLGRAQELAETAERIAAEGDLPAKERRVAAHLARAWVATERQRESQAVHWLDCATRTDELRHDSVLTPLSILLRARLTRDRGDSSGARQLLTSWATEVEWLRAEFEAEVAHLVPAASPAEVAAGPSRPTPHAEAPGTDSEAHHRHADTVLESMEPTIQTVTSQVERLLQQAQRHCARGKSDHGRSLVLQALALGKAERVRRPFRHAGPLVKALIRSDVEVAARAEWLAPVSARRSKHAMVGASPELGPGLRPVPDAGRTEPRPPPLTARELEVLRHVSDLLSTQEIAASMFISVNTVKTHVRHILDKLSVTRRKDAVRRARELGLV